MNEKDKCMITFSNILTHIYFFLTRKRGTKKIDRLNHSCYTLSHQDIVYLLHLYNSWMLSLILTAAPRATKRDLSLTNVLILSHLLSEILQKLHRWVSEPWLKLSLKQAGTDKTLFIRSLSVFHVIGMFMSLALEREVDKSSGVPNRSMRGDRRHYSFHITCFTGCAQISLSTQSKKSINIWVFIKPFLKDISINTNGSKCLFPSCWAKPSFDVDAKSYLLNNIPFSRLHLTRIVPGLKLSETSDIWVK